MIASTKEHKLEDTTLEPKEKDIPQLATCMVPTLAGYTNLQTLKIEGFLEQQSIIILIDTESTHKFMSNKVAAHLMLQKESYNGFEVKVANGQILKCNQKCPRVKLILQEQDVVADFFLLSLDGFDIVLSIDWLSTIRDMEFFEANHEVFQKKKVGDSTKEPSDYNHNTTHGGGTKRKIQWFPNSN
ncbi:hypothetical protein B296_00034407 [Ensete ventricosum]|uniref:Uncharacterized protein n=1 Tax=Ensete ventricosum TaxID=4639 RepID=A0A426WYK6_ENSVE|nr:hypothetical protein B296_00034407 [Ensete ventricosum]